MSVAQSGEIYFLRYYEAAEIALPDFLRLCVAQNKVRRFA